jgi:hypothetical protein
VNADLWELWGVGNCRRDWKGLGCEVLHRGLSKIAWQRNWWAVLTPSSVLLLLS